MSRRKGFTLIELLVVIAIIALLLSILLPSLQKAKELASGIACLSNQKSLALAWAMYAGANKDKIVGGECKYNIVNGIPPWVKPPLSYSGGAIVNQNNNPNVSLEHRKNGFREGALFTYLDNPKSYHCPGDNRVTNGTSRGASLPYRIYRSYSMPYGVAPNVSNNKRIAIETNWFFQPITKIGMLKVPSQKYIFVEEAYDGKAYRYNDECWNFVPYNQDGSYKYELWDPLGSFHVKSCTFAFADGHTDKHKWRDKDTIDFFENRPSYGGGTFTFPGNKDIEWLADSYPFLPAR